MTTTEIDRVGSWTSTLIGLPIGLAFSFFVLYISLFPPIDFGLAAIGGGLFWHPLIWGGLIPLTFIFLLWIAGNKIKSHLDKKFSTIKTSFLFTLYINAWLFGLFLLIFLSDYHSFSFFSFSAALALTILTFIIATAFTTFTIGLLIVTITKNKINKKMAT